MKKIKFSKKELMEKANKKIKEILKYSGLKLNQCKCFDLKDKYFNIYLNQDVWESPIYTELIRIANTTNIISKVEPNGVNRLAIFY